MQIFLKLILGVDALTSYIYLVYLNYYALQTERVFHKIPILPGIRLLIPLKTTFYLSSN